MNVKKLTVGFIVAVVALVTIFDCWTIWANGYDSTISWTLFVVSKDWPIIPFALGVLAGHLFFPNHAANAPIPGAK